MLIVTCFFFTSHLCRSKIFCCSLFWFDFCYFKENQAQDAFLHISDYDSTWPGNKKKLRPMTREDHPKPLPKANLTAWMILDEMIQLIESKSLTRSNHFVNFPKKSTLHPFQGTQFPLALRIPRPSHHGRSRATSAAQPVAPGLHRRGRGGDEAAGALRGVARGEPTALLLQRCRKGPERHNGDGGGWWGWWGWLGIWMGMVDGKRNENPHGKMEAFLAESSIWWEMNWILCGNQSNWKSTNKLKVYNLAGKITNCERMGEWIYDGVDGYVGGVTGCTSRFETYSNVGWVDRWW